MEAFLLATIAKHSLWCYIITTTVLCRTAKLANHLVSVCSPKLIPDTAVSCYIISCDQCACELQANQQIHTCMHA